MKKEHIKGKKFSEFVGHTPYQVAVGSLIGILLPFGIKLLLGL